MAYEHLFDGVLCHTLTFTGVSLMSGHATWRLFVGPREPQGRAEGAFFLGGTVLALVGAVINLRQATLSMASKADPAAITGVLTQTAFGHGLLVHVLCLAIALACWLGLRRANRPLLMGLPLVGALFGQSLLGHASAVGVWTWLFVAYVVHVVAITVWFGGLLVLIQRLAHGYRAAMTRDLSPFSRMAGVAMLAILISGTIVARQQVPALSGLLSAYGWTLVAKHGLVLVVLVLAAGHRLRRLPALLRDPRDVRGWRAFDGALTREAMVTFVVIVLAAGLSQLPPPGE